MARSVEALVEAKLLVWARESANLSEVDAAEKAKVAPEKLQEWEAGTSRPTVAKARELARIYKRPLSVLYLPEPPTDFAALHDFRLLPGEALEQSGGADVCHSRSPAAKGDRNRCSSSPISCASSSAA